MRENDSREREERLAEERLLLMTQIAVQRELNKRGMKYRDLAARLEVSEARVSQLMGGDALNLTIRTVAKIFYRLGERAVLMTQREFDAAMRSDESSVEVTWEFTSPPDTVLNLKDEANIVIHISPESMPDWTEWKAGEAAMLRRSVA